MTAILQMLETEDLKRRVRPRMVAEGRPYTDLRTEIPFAALRSADVFRFTARDGRTVYGVEIEVQAPPDAVVYACWVLDGEPTDDQIRWLAIEYPLGQMTIPT